MDSQDDATRQPCTHVFKSALRQYRYNLRKLTLKARLTVNFPKHLKWKIYRMKTGGALLNTGLIRSIRYIIYM